MCLISKRASSEHMPSITFNAAVSTGENDITALDLNKYNSVTWAAAATTPGTKNSLDEALVEIKNAADVTVPVTNAQMTTTQIGASASVARGIEVKRYIDDVIIGDPTGAMHDSLDTLKELTTYLTGNADIGTATTNILGQKASTAGSETWNVDKLKAKTDTLNHAIQIGEDSATGVLRLELQDGTFKIMSGTVALMTVSA